MALAVLLGFSFSSPAFGQVVYGGGVAFSAQGRHVRIGGFLGGYTIRPAYPYYGGTYFYSGYGPGWRPGSGNPYFLPPPGGLAPPPFGPPVFGPPWYYPPPVIVVPPPVIIVPPPVVVASNPSGGADPIGPPGAKPGQFLVINPKKDVQQASANPMIPEGTIVPAVDKVMVPKPMPRFDPAAGPPMGNVEKPEANPEREFARLMKLARDAFAAEEYGRAVGNLDRAAKVKPTDAMPHFLKAQSHLAAGQYAEALDAIRIGMKLNPNWPTSGYRPRDFYGTNPDRFNVHLAALRTALAENVGDPSLQFLLGYELWFGGNRAEAVELFRAAKREPLAARFLKDADKP